MPREAVQTLSFRGRRSRNKVSVGEPAEGSLPVFPPAPVRTAVGGTRVGLKTPRAPPPPLATPSPRGTRSRAPRGILSSRSLRSCAAARTEGRTTLCRVARRVAGASDCAPRLVAAPTISTRGAPSLTVRPASKTQHSNHTQLPPMDILALATMKNAAKCDT